MYYKHTQSQPAPSGRASGESVSILAQLAGGLALGGWLGIFLLLFVGAGLFSYLPCASFAELGLFLFFVGALARNYWRWRRTALDPLIGSLLVVQILATVWSYAAGYGDRSPYAPGADSGGLFGPLQLLFDQFAAWAAYYVVAWKLQELREPPGQAEGSPSKTRAHDPLFVAFMLSAGVVLLLCLIEWAASFVHSSDDPRIQATFTNPNLLASYLVLAAPVAAGAAYQSSAGKAARIALSLLAAGLFFALWLSQSRGAWIGMALGAGFMAAVLWIQRAAGDTSRRKRGRLSLRLFATGSLAALLFGAFVAPRIDAHWHGHSEEERAIIWSAAVSIIRAHPLLGVGENGFAAAMADLHLKQKNDFNPSGYPLVPAIHLHAHNLLLQAAAEKGVLGIAAWLWLVGAILARCRRLFMDNYSGRGYMPIAAAAGAGWIALLTQCVADYTLWYAPVLICAWIALSIFFALSETRTLTDKLVAS